MYAAQLRDEICHMNLDVVVMPPAVAISALAPVVRGTNIHLGAQNAHFAVNGSFTGELSVPMLRDAGAEYILLGHSERREQFAETDQLVNRKVNAALRSGTRPIVCVGESRAQRRSGDGIAHVLTQVSTAMNGVSAEDVPRVVVAYEPVWAVGTDEGLSPEAADEMLGHVRLHISELYDADIAKSVHLLYGGGLRPNNAAEYISRSQIDGALVGAATATVASFVGIAQALLADPEPRRETEHDPGPRRHLKQSREARR